MFYMKRSAAKTCICETNKFRFMTSSLSLVLLTSLVTWEAACAQGPIHQIHAVLGGTAVLPCNTESKISNDRLLVILWYKDDHMLYSYDLRRKLTKSPTVWSESRRLHYALSPSALSLHDVTSNDEGVYRCRVDFEFSPSRNTKANLSVTVPPRSIVITDVNGKELRNVTSPHLEDSTLSLTCIVVGGKPTPTVRWWRNERLLDSRSSTTVIPSVTHKQLLVPNLSRSDLHSIFTCQAVNSNLVPPVSKSVELDMHLTVTGVRLLQPEQPLSAGRRYKIWCKAIGSRPAPRISWWLGSQRLNATFHQMTSIQENETEAVIYLVTQPEDNGKLLTCRAENEEIPGSVVEDTIILTVYYKPTAKVKTSQSGHLVKEGSYVYLQCDVDANPRAYKITWKHQGIPVEESHADGVRMMGSAMEMQSVRRKQAGLYSCVASNVEGDGVSEVEELKVMYKPACRSGLQKAYAVARHEAAHVLCETDAFPAPDSFRWAFNNSAESVDVPQSWYNSSLSASVLRYTPVVDLDYGSLLCWAANAAGRQHAPCVFHVIPQSHPETPNNCSLYNQTSRSIQVKCEPGFDGGRQQYFQLEVTDKTTHRLLANLTSRVVDFTIDQLIPGQTLEITLYAVNGKGRSEIIEFDGFTLKEPEKQTGSNSPLNLTYLLSIVFASVFAIIMIAVATVAYKHCCHKVPLTTNLELKEQSSVFIRDSFGKDDRNPDVIPYVKGSHCSTFRAVMTPLEEENEISSSHLLIESEDFVQHQISSPCFYSCSETVPYATLRPSPRSKIVPQPVVVNPGQMNHQAVVTAGSPQLESSLESCV